MTFAIDTGHHTEDAATYIPDWFMDQINDPSDRLRASHDFAYHLIGALNNPKTMATVRKHTLRNWGFLRLLAQEHPDVFDEFWSAYAERYLTT